MSLAKDVRTYNRDCLPELQLQKEYYEGLKNNLTLAIQQAAMGLVPRANGSGLVMSSHQRRIGKSICNEGWLCLQNEVVKIKAAKDFDKLLEITCKAAEKVPRLGRLWSYDTAQRIGFALSIYPTEVYLHAGVIAGASKDLKRPIGKDEKRLPVSAFSPELRDMDPYVLENFFCIWGNGHLKPC